MCDAWHRVCCQLMIAIKIIIIFLLALVYRCLNFYISEGIVYLHINFLTKFLTQEGPDCPAAKYQDDIFSVSGIYIYKYKYIFYICIYKIQLFFTFIKECHPAYSLLSLHFSISCILLCSLVFTAI